MGWFSKHVKKIRHIAEKVDPLGTKINKAMAKVPGSHQALEEGLYRGAIGKASWNPYDKKGVAVGDIWGGGTRQSKDPEARAIGRQIGTSLGSYFGGAALSGLFGGSSAASGAGAGVDMGGGTGISATGGNVGLTSGGGVGFQAPASSSYFLGAPETYSSALGTTFNAVGEGASTGAGGFSSQPYSDLQWSPNQQATVEGLNNTLSDTATDAYRMQTGSQALGENYGAATQAADTSAATLDNTGLQSYGEGVTPDTTSMTPSLENAGQGVQPTNIEQLYQPSQATTQSFNGPTYGQTTGATTGNTGMNLKNAGQWGKRIYDWAGAYDSYQQNKANLEELEPYRDAYNATARELSGLYNNPMKGYDEFMMGQGRQWTNDARAQAARSGRLRSYMNSGKMNTDLMSLYMTNVDNRKKMLSQSLQSQAPYLAQFQNLQANKNAPLYSAGTRTLAGLFG